MPGAIGTLLALRRTSEPRDPDASRVGWTGRTLAGVNITPDTAVQISAVWACLRYLSQSVAVLPWHIMKPAGRGSEVNYKHPLDWMIWKRPNPEWSSFQFRETLTHWALRWGNGYAEIEEDMVGRPYAMWPVHPDRVEVCRALEAMPEHGIGAGELYYEVSNGIGGRVVVPMRRMFHVRGFGEGPVGINVMDYAAQSLGWAKAAQLFGASFFGNGANVSGIVIAKKGFGDGAVKRLKAELGGLYKGVRNANKVAFLDHDMDWKTVGIDPEKSQLLEINMFLVEEVCRWFGVPPHKVMHLLRSTFNNIEHQAIEVVVDAVSPWVKRFEDEADFKLFGQNRQGLFTKMNMRGLLRGDFKSQNEGLEVARRNAIINADEWREFLDMNEMPAGAGGEKYVMQAHNTTLEKIGEVVPAPQSEESAKAAIAALALEWSPANVG
jgi:HK97 family phage portal protein